VLLTAQTAATGMAVLSSAWQFEQAAAPTAWVTPGTEYKRFTGFVDKWPHQWTNGVLGTVTLTATDRQKLLSRQLLGAVSLTDEQLSGARAAALLVAAGVTSVDVDAGLSVLGLTGNESTQSIQALLREVARSEAGLFFIAGDDTAVFQDRGQRQRPSVIVLAVAADQCGPDLNFVVDDALLINDATVITDDGQESSLADAASDDEYGTYSKRLETLLTSTAEASDRAAYLLAQYAEPQPRAGQISIEARSQRTLDLWVEGIQDVITDETWWFTLDPSPAAVTISFILDDPTYGALDSNRLGW
jgi:hypothetical protein